MKRKLTFFTFVLTTLLLTGCARGNTPGTGNSASPEPSTPPSSTGAVHSTEQSQSQATQNNETSAQQISEEAAREIALTHAGLAADQVTFIKSEIDTDIGRKHYDVEFITKDHKEYDYEIDMYTGEILDYDYEAEYYPQSSETAPSETAPSETAPSETAPSVNGT